MIAQLKKVANLKGFNINGLIYKKHPIDSDYGNPALEMDVLLLMNWLTFSYGHYIESAVLLRKENALYVYNETALTEDQMTANREYYESYGLTPVTEKQEELFLASAIMAMFVNGDALVVTPVEMRDRLVEVEQGVMCLSVTKTQYAKVCAPNRNGLASQLDIDKSFEIAAHELQTEVRDEIEPLL
ncbi:MULTISPECIES: hypothetical protein [Vibrio]|uniref:hypothetical protein n=1 Tax=Vibrio TaxID=662 RepID=UPI001E62A735|nr:MULTISPECIES: hypothetical protein [Vibrio]MCC2524933.1 hypothetical protein [Vibrio coralliilyticus]USD35478.1 hypothetical protein J8Z27_22935 [Vibrio sp. SCSIO 43186]USD72602.1 hypothetical protein J4N41_22940 [Vibrio sp. SCSIO 43139]USD98993.1 hypothetical protein CTT30_23250 [Vibrio coralliilyticus]